ncbi:MAG: universal stress protein [Flavobacteriaceae bacterium]|nr:universal stress protein [Flavobacteriaceae bacterium]
MKNILIPTDFSDYAWNALLFALELFRGQSLSLHILHTIPNDTHSSTTTERQLNSSEAKTAMRALQQKIYAETPHADYRVCSLIRRGKLVDSIRNEVEERKIDLIVMGSKGQSGKYHQSIGKHTADVIHKVQCTTLVIPERAQFSPINNIALPTDFSIYLGPKILTTLTYFSKLCKATVQVFHLKKSFVDLVEDQRENRENLKEFLSDIPHDFHEVSSKEMDLSIQKCIEEHDIKLIAMVAKNIYFFQQLFFNTETDQLAYRQKIPFLVLHDR